MGSMGFILADWSIEVIRAQRKKEKKQNKSRDLEKNEMSQQFKDVSCASCGQLSEQLAYIEKQLTKIKLDREKISQLFKKESVEDIMVEVKMLAETNKLKSSKKQLKVIKEEMLKGLENDLKCRDITHSEKVKSLEIKMAEKEKQLLQSSNMLRQQLVNETKEIQQLTKQLENRYSKITCDDPKWQHEVESLQMVIEMKKDELNQLTTTNHSLRQDIDRLVGLEEKLQVDKHSTEEMSEEIKIKNNQLSQVVDKYEHIQHQLDIEIAAHLACQQELEKIQWEKDNFLDDPESVISQIGSKNWKNMTNRKAGKEW